MSQASHGLDLDRLIVLAADRYRQFTNTVAPDDARDFTAYCTACKAAIAHLDQLIRFAQAFEPGAASNQSSPIDLDALISEAQASLPNSHSGK